MKVIVVGNQKGGVGKSMIAANIAVCAAKDGKRVLMIDADTQGTTMTWRDIRKDDNLSAVSITTTALAKDISNFDNHDLVVIDAGGRDDARFRAAVMCSRFGVMVVPVLSGPSDIWATQDTLDVISEARAVWPELPIHLFLNRVKTKATLVKQAKELLKQLADAQDVATMNVSIGDREDLPKAYACGKGVVEATPHSKAAEEVTELYNEIKGLLGGAENE